MRVLIVEDDRKLGSLLRCGLEEAGLHTHLVADGETALRWLETDAAGVVVLDVMLPGVDGFGICRALRDRGDWTPILMLTARDAIDDRIRGLDGGADDYVAKPVSLGELAARVRALARRGPVAHPVELGAGDLRMRPAERRAWRGEHELDLSATECRLLEALLRHAGQVLDRGQLLDHAWPVDEDRRSNVVDVYIRYLREKVDRPFGVQSIETVRGTGYRLRADGGRG
jgi:two-component system OmpR family response regulator